MIDKRATKLSKRSANCKCKYIVESGYSELEKYIKTISEPNLLYTGIVKSIEWSAPGGFWDDSGWFPDRLQVLSLSAPGGFRVSVPGQLRVVSGSAPGAFRVGSGCFPGRFRMVSGSAPGTFRVDPGWFPCRFRVGSSRFRVTSGSAPGELEMVSGPTLAGFRFGTGWFPGQLLVVSGSALGVFRMGSGSVPDELRVLSGSAPGSFRVSLPGQLRVVSGLAPAAFRVGSGWFPGRHPGAFRVGCSERLPGSAPAALPAEAEDVLKFERGLRVMIETSTLLNPGSLDTKFGASPVVPRVKTLARYKVAAVGKKHQT
ncbi:hypothetical protein GEV33_003456 [Tenebrio molitor]|uniref:Uncharacterized protein n=1 Tax=Tenebrio molitor TaxID=7067 RepID=A0A8J6LFB3_TENMO|nr:hypothetical protein GEV33_003456 [Tenebrio molitor]